MGKVAFADVAHQSISFDRAEPAGALVLELIDAAWMQRLRDISQTANTRLVFMFSEHSRFGHSLGVAYLAQMLMDKLERHFAADISPYRLAVSAAALLHDVGHIAPGSHTAYKTWFPGKPDLHEGLVTRIIEEDEEVRSILMKYGSDLPAKVVQILSHSPEVPPWTWELITGGGWNADRGNWCIVDSILAGVSYGQYNVSALTESMMLTREKHLALQENRLDAMMHFAVSRHAMYRQLYQHRVLLAADMLNKALIQRARDLGREPCFADETMRRVLAAATVSELPVDTIYQMREAWWRYHLYRWCEDEDAILSDLSERLVSRRLLKTVRVQEGESLNALHAAAVGAVTEAGFDPAYYLHEVSTINVHGGDLSHSLRVIMDNDTMLELHQAEPLIETLVHETGAYQKLWLAMPIEAKRLMGRQR